MYSMETDTFGLSWNSFQKHLTSTFLNLFSEKDFSDITLVTDDQTQFKAHKFVLSACSPVFQSLLLDAPHPHSLLYLNGVKKKELECILQFMYLGETNIDQDSIHEFFNIANSFRVKQLEQQLLPPIDDEQESVDAANIPPDDTSNLTQIREYTKLVVQTENINDDTKLSTNNEQKAETGVNKKMIMYTEKNDDNNILDQPQHLIHENRIKPSKNTYLKVFKCELCSYEARRADTLLRHCQMVHEGVRYSCNECDHTSSDKGNLRKHQKIIHEGYKYTCNYCEYKANWSKSLRHHMKIYHVEEPSVQKSKIRKQRKKNVQCDHCEYRPTKPGNLKRHEETVHGINLKYYECNLCPYKGKEKARLKIHEESVHHNIRYNCDVWDYSVKDSRGLLVHQRRKHQLSQDECDARKFIIQ